MRTILCLSLCLTLVWMVACGSEESAQYSDYAVEASAPAVDYAYEVSEAEAYETVSANLSEKAPTSIAPLPTAAQQRKIIFNANVQLVVDEFEGVPASVQALADKHGGFIASSSVQGSEGEPRRGNWTLRVPSEHFHKFLDGSKTIGQVRSLSSDSQEVTAEYVDLEARASNLRKEEQRLHKHLEESTRSLKDILEVEREIARVRGEIERIVGRLNVLKDLTSLSTVTLTIEEIKDYVPEVTEEPGFATQVARTWSASIDAVGGFFTRLSLATVGFIPWLTVVLPLALVGWLVFRKLRHHVGRAVPAAAGPTEK